MSRWAIVIKDHLTVDKNDPLMDVCPVRSYTKAKEILDRYYSDFVEYYREKNRHRPMIPLSVKLEWKPETLIHGVRLVINVHDPQNKENLFISYEIRDMIEVRMMDQRHLVNVNRAETEPVFP